MLPQRKPRVLLVTVGLEVGGTESQLLEIADRLNGERFDVLVCALKGEGTIGHEMRSRGIQVVTLNGAGRMDPRVLVRLFYLIRAVRPDIIHSFLPVANYAATIVGFLLRVPILVASYRAVEPWRRVPGIWLDQLVVRLVRRITCCSDAVRSFAIQRFGGDQAKYMTIYNGIDMERFHHGTATKKSLLGLQDTMATIGTVCRLDEPTKGISVLLTAISQLKAMRDVPPFQLVIIGEGRSAEALCRLRDDLALSEVVIFAGLRRDVERILPLLDLFVLPSLSEGFGIALLEAMASGCPVVATAVGGIPEIVPSPDTGLLVPAGDPTSLAHALADLLCNQEKAQALGKAGQERACAQFSVSIMVKHHERLYEQLLETMMSGDEQTEKSTVRV
ncbi:MAG: glycosyltransferase [Nitrospira sp.]